MKWASILALAGSVNESARSLSFNDTECYAGLIFADHLAPGAIGRDEAAFLRHLLLDSRGEPRGELFRLIAQPEIFHHASDLSEAALISHLMPLVSADLSARLRAITAYENVATLLDSCWDWLRYLSTQTGARALRRAEFADVSEVREGANQLPERLHLAEQALRNAPRFIPEQYADLAHFFECVEGAESLYDALLDRHARVQKAKPPEGKREWFERAANGSVFVRIP